MLVYRVTLKSQMFIVKELFNRAIFYSCIMYLLMLLYPGIFTHNTIWGLSAVSFWIIGYCFWELLPLTTVHFQYLKYNKQTELSIDKNKQVMIIKEGDNIFVPIRSNKKNPFSINGGNYEGQKTGVTTSNISLCGDQNTRWT